MRFPIRHTESYEQPQSDSDYLGRPDTEGPPYIIELMPRSLPSRANAQRGRCLSLCMLSEPIPRRRYAWLCGGRDLLVILFVRRHVGGGQLPMDIDPTCELRLPARPYYHGRVCDSVIVVRAFLLKYRQHSSPVTQRLFGKLQ